MRSKVPVCFTCGTERWCWKASRRTGSVLGSIGALMRMRRCGSVGAKTWTRRGRAPGPADPLGSWVDRGGGADGEGGVGCPEGLGGKGQVSGGGGLGGGGEIVADETGREGCVEDFAGAAVEAVQVQGEAVHPAGADLER